MTEQESRQVPINEAMRLATEHHQAGRLQQAEAIYRAILDSDPENLGATYNLGLIALQGGRPGQAVPVLKAALEANPTDAAYWMNYAIALAGSGNPTAARDVLLQARSRGLGGSALAGLLAQVERMVSSRTPAVVETFEGGNRGQVRAINLTALSQLNKEGRHAELEAAAIPLTTQFPDSEPLWQLLGASYLAQNKHEQAREAFARAAERMPENPRVLNLLGLALRLLKRNDEAREAFSRALASAPDDFDTLLNASANALTLRDLFEARNYAERALAVRPDSVDALRVLADAAAAGGGSEEAVHLYRRAIALDPNSPDLYTNLGDALTDLGRADEAAAAVQSALALRPNDAHAHLSLGRALYQLGETPAAREHFRAASDAAPDMAEAHTAYLFCLAHDETVAPDQSFAEHIRIGDLIEAPFRDAWRSHENDRDPERDLRIGFVSADLREHAIAYLIEPVWQAMRTGRNKVIAYAHLASEDAVSRRLRGLTDEWVRIERMNDEALCERIHADRIDILFDLSGHTTHNRLTAFARKPAPIQVSWLGYPGTTGLSAMDYRFVRGLDSKDAEMEKLFREKLVRFRYRGFQPESSAPAVNPLPALAAKRLTFGSFNRPGKIGEAVIALWSRVLRALPESRLLIAAAGEQRLQERLRASFAAHGVAPERLDFRARVALPQYLAMHEEVDIALDTFPYTGGTTTSHALWMGVPVLTLAGPGLQQNQAAAILRMLDMTAWVTDTEDAFVRQACDAAVHLPELAALRNGLRERMSRIFQDSLDDTARELDAAFRTMWRRWCAGQPPETIAVQV